MPDDSTAERHPSRGDLEKLIRAKDICESETGTARERFGAAMEKATKRGLNKFAFGIIIKLWKMDPAKAALNLRAIEFYAELLGLNAQGDLEDAMAAAEREPEPSDANGASAVNSVVQLKARPRAKKVRGAVAH